MIKAENLPGYYRIPSDNRDLNYGKYFVDGEEVVSAAEDYHSHNTERLGVEQIVAKLKDLAYIQDELKLRVE
jgi:UDP-glucose 4-epimerase